MGGNRKRRQQAAENTSRTATNLETQRAADLSTQLNQRKATFGAGLPETMENARNSAKDLSITGGFKPEEITPVRESYTNFTNTGGFTPEDKDLFLRKSIAPTNAVYSGFNDQLAKQKALQGNYTPGFSASSARIARQKAIAGSEASLNANADLASQVRQGKLVGTAGLQNMNEAVQRGRISGNDALQRYSQFGASALSDTDVNELRNRLQSGQMSQSDSQLLTTLAAQDKTLFDKIMQGVSVATGGVAGLMGATK